MVDSKAANPKGKHRFPPSATTPLDKCAVCGIGKLSLTSRSISAKCIDFDGILDVEHKIKECCRRSCRAHHAYNFVWKGSAKLNTLKSGQVGEMLFVTGTHAFSKRFLHYHSELDFRSFTSARAIADVYMETIGGQQKFRKFRNLYGSAITYFNAMQEFEAFGEHRNIVIGRDLPATSVAKYESHMHIKGFLPPDVTQIKEMIGDGHAKVHMKLDVPPKRQAGAPRKRKGRKKKTLCGQWLAFHRSSGHSASIGSDAHERARKQRDCDKNS